MPPLPSGGVGWLSLLPLGCVGRESLLLSEPLGSWGGVVPSEEPPCFSGGVVPSEEPPC